ncbi:MAG: hypothetical protein DWB56_06825 [Candidatus Jettenia sp.]|uniref:NTP pyrophosphohydrolase MazG putative catalytic core domain-containing protein n=1 Tax=Candidatus Jettenia caeni TaxID=247490 RepID=I3IMY7_9BACT|nr:hypothetical protein [Candidatus Jettenia sp. AMX1]MBC6928667.1 hypothetical protein [Candidatus Jettenia sp.]GAB63082.1 conserved hypothetical protein [Candidatus Jettenia caeni]KAA0250645.1 MAG: hypothetical protein EDM77_03765 [Candidatus Jettenia sp. AMX1]MCE7879979.1 hypothetical protein [Candidatus Jettenia sp. AMX1]MCQ3926761.1 hypothetical protein [Candidatus Jettenia sp.]
MTIKELQKQVHEMAKEKGWWDKSRSIGEMIALCHSELSEALEDYRAFGCNFETRNDNDKPEGFAVELADCIIRILDMCEHLEINLQEALEKKIEHNKTRPYRHGNKVI